MRDNWLEITSRLAVGAVPDVDVADRDQPCRPAIRATRPKTGVAEATENSATPRPATKIWPLTDEAATPFGVRVRRAPADVRPLAARLAAAAAERNTAPVILSHVNRSGFEHLGFRVERIHAESLSEEQIQEDEIAAFWNLAVIVDLEDIQEFA